MIVKHYVVDGDAFLVAAQIDLPSSCNRPISR
jgi:hypothetical protein